LIGGKLRALYDDDAQPVPDRVIELLGALTAAWLHLRKNNSSADQGAISPELISSKSFLVSGTVASK
jgi:hypothetical protein